MKKGERGIQEHAIRFYNIYYVAKHDKFRLEAGSEIVYLTESAFIKYFGITYQNYDIHSWMGTLKELGRVVILDIKTPEPVPQQIPFIPLVES